MVRKFALSLVALVSAPALAQQSEIVVTGQVEVPEAVARSHVNAIVDPVDGQIARYIDGVCPAITGVTPDFAARLDARIRKVASAAGAAEGAEGCKPNLVVMFTDKPAALFSQVGGTEPTWIKSLSKHRVKELGNSDAKVLSWAVTSSRNLKGERLQDPNSPFEPSSARVDSVSLFDKSSKQVIDTAFVIVSLDAVNGRQLWQIADHIAMRALTPIEVPGSSAVPTVLTAFDQAPEDAPAMITATDLALLRGIYASDGMTNKSTEVARLARTISNQ
ncbi:hypothetical protein [Tsuneonella sp. HG222]